MECEPKRFAITSEFRKYEFTIQAIHTTNHASMQIVNASKAPVLIGAVSLMPADNVRGFRRDTLELLKQLGAPIYRWPGGNFVSGYDWRDGIGPRDRRPPRKNPAWTGVEHNDVGIDEFIDLCREINTASRSSKVRAARWHSQRLCSAGFLTMSVFPTYRRASWMPGHPGATAA